MDEVDKLAEVLTNRLNCKAVVSKLGINKKLVNKLCRAGLLGNDRGGMRDLSRSLTTAAELAKFADSIISLAPPRDVDPSRSITLIDAAQYYHVPFVTLCVAIRDGRIRPCGLRAKGSRVAEVLLYRQDVKRLQVRSMLSLQQTAAALDIHFDAARDLVRLGMLSASTHHKRQHYRIRPADIDNFRRQYVTAKDAGVILGIQPKCVGGHVRCTGFRPAISPPLCRQTFYHRSEITRAAQGYKGTDHPSRHTSH